MKLEKLDLIFQKVIIKIIDKYIQMKQDAMSNFIKICDELKVI